MRNSSGYTLRAFTAPILALSLSSCVGMGEEERSSPMGIHIAAVGSTMVADSSPLCSVGGLTVGDVSDREIEKTSE